MRRYPWTKYLKRSAPELPYDSPIYLGSWSNGEFFHEQTPFERKVREEILKAGDARARKLGLDRREFMASAMGFVTALSMINQACSREVGTSPPPRDDAQSLGGAMTRRYEQSLWCAAIAAVLMACGGEETGDSDPVTRSVGCMPDTTAPCTCAGGKSGMQKCQLDGTFGLCNCSAAAAAGSPAGGLAGSSPSAGVAGSAAGPMTAPSMGMMPGMTPGGRPNAPPAGMMPAAPAPEPVIVPPEDAMACTGVGTAPSMDEAVEVLKIRTSDVVPGGFKAPGGTLYTCFWVEIDMPEKRHIIGWEGAVGGDRAVHHQQVSLGAKPFYLAQQGGLCGLPSVEYTWTGERPPEWTPSLAGYPIGGPENGGKARFLWQTHFEGATTYTGGFNAYVTKKLRKYDAGNFEQGDVRGIMIPPKASITHTAKCTPEMTRAKFSHPIYVFSSMLHAHLTVRKIKNEHFRDGKLLTTLGEEATMGFAGFFDQSFHPHTPCVQLLPGDELITTCDYQNPWDIMVTGGEATNQEMCTTFMQYFPRLPKPSDNFCGTIDATGGFTGMP